MKAVFWEHIQPLGADTVGDVWGDVWVGRLVRGSAWWWVWGRTGACSQTDSTGRMLRPDFTAVPRVRPALEGHGIGPLRVRARDEEAPALEDAEGAAKPRCPRHFDDIEGGRKRVVDISIDRHSVACT